MSYAMCKLMTRMCKLMKMSNAMCKLMNMSYAMCKLIARCKLMNHIME